MSSSSTATDPTGASSPTASALYVTLGVPGSALLPGAARAVDLLKSDGVSVIVVTAKYEPNARRCLEYVGLAVDEVFGWRHGPAKAEVLKENGAIAYVGDTEADMIAARRAGIPGLGVTTGPHNADELIAAGAATTVGSLAEFANWWSSRPR